MNYYLEEDIIDAYNNNELDGIDIINLYDYGYISENLIDEFLEDGHLDETLSELSNYSNILEGVIGKSLHLVGKYGIVAAGTGAGLALGSPLAASVGAVLANDSYDHITNFLKKKREERKAKEAQKKEAQKAEAAKKSQQDGNRNKENEEGHEGDEHKAKEANEGKPAAPKPKIPTPTKK